MLDEKEASEPGPYTFDTTPYWRFVIDLAALKTVEELVCIKGAQIGWSELCRNFIGYCVDLDPGPILILMPDRKSANDFRDERIEPLIQNTDAVRRHLTSRAWDSTKHRVKFDTCSLFIAWAGSKSGTKSRPIRRLICEEPDEYPPFSSKGGDPLSKAEKRLTTFRRTGRSTMLIGGTPTNRLGNIWKRWDLCAAKYHFWVPCPECNGFQRLLWKQVKWPDLGEPDRNKRSQAINGGNLAYYECEHCKAHLRDHHKPRMLRRGVWATEDQAVTVDGRVVGPPVTARRVGVAISGLYSPWLRFSELASEFIEAQNDPEALADFVNQRLAEPFEQQRAKIEPELIQQKAVGAPPPMVCPSWAKWLVVTADTQGNNDQDGYFYYVIRAWGYEYRSQLVDFGVCHSRAELVQRSFDRPIPFELGGTVTPQVLFPDSGGPRWNEIYQLAQSDSRIHPTKGASKDKTWMVEERPQKQHNVVLWMIDTNQAKDQLHRLINDPDRTKWMPHAGINPDYCRQMASEAKIFNPSRKREEWVEIVTNNNHFWDCEAIQCAVAWRLGAGAPEPPPDPAVADEPSAQPKDSWANAYKGRY